MRTPALHVLTMATLMGLGGTAWAAEVSIPVLASPVEAGQRIDDANITTKTVDRQTVFANTRKDKRGHTQRNQSLLEHLVGVGHTASLIAHALPGFERHLPRLANHRGLRKRSADKRFAWPAIAALPSLPGTGRATTN